MHKSLGYTLALLFIFTYGVSSAELKVSDYFTDNMVIQRGKRTTIKGMSSPNAQVKVSLLGKESVGMANPEGQWEVTLEAMPATSKPSNLVISAEGKSKTINNVLIGDVILFARQTSIDISLGRDEDGKRASETAGELSFRVVSIGPALAPSPQHGLPAGATAGWSKVNPSVALKTSAAAFYLGKSLSESLDVPVGIIDLNLGERFAASWVSRSALSAQSEKMAGKIDGQRQKYDHFVNKTPYGKHKKILTEDPMEHPYFASAGFDAILHPLRGTGLKAILVQLGTDYPYYIYERLMNKGGKPDRAALNQAYILTYDLRKEGYRMEPTVINSVVDDWRKNFGEEALPFAFVTTPGSAHKLYGIHNREMRELHRRVSEDKEGVGVVLPGMKTIPFSGQPKDEKLLSERAKVWLEGAVYGKASSSTGPAFERFEAVENQATIYFRPGTALGLQAAEGALDHFEVANTDSVYFPATAKIDGETIKLMSDDVSRIFYVRYNWRQHPDEGLTNSLGLPAMPFRTENAHHQWFSRHKEDELPEEYRLPANEWKGGAVTLINAQMEKVGYLHFSGWLGPLGVKVGPFGPNMGVREIKKGSPAEGKLEIGDLIYEVNGEMLGDDEEMVMSRAITEVEASDGVMTLSLRRGTELKKVVLNLKPMGRYSSTSPWDCLKTDRIVRNLEEYLFKQGLPNGYMAGSAMFMLGAGSPEYQGAFRHAMTRNLKGGGGNNWMLGYMTILMSEYYLSTGDKRVLPGIQSQVDKIAELQIKEDSKRKGGWYGRGSNPRSYPAMAHVGVSSMLGMTLAKETGVKVNEECFQLGLDYLKRKGAEYGIIIYGDAFRDKPSNIDPEKMFAGKLHTDNGKIAEAAVLYDLLENKPAAHLNSLISTHAWYSTFGGHGGNFWNNFWTPLGSAVHGKDAYQYFMKHHRWYRECARMFDGSLLQNEGKLWEGGTGLALVVPRQRLRILGAPKSPFSPDAPEILTPALDAYWSHDFTEAKELAANLLEDNKTPKEHLGTIGRLVEESERMLASIAHDFESMKTLLSEGRVFEAEKILKGVVLVMAENDSKLLELKASFESTEARKDDEMLYMMSRSGLGGDKKAKMPKNASEMKKMEAAKKKAEQESNLDKGSWVALTTKEFFASKKKKKPSPAEASLEKASKWKYQVLESRDGAPEGWMLPDFDDSLWTETTLPISWHLNHTFVGRTKFTVDNIEQFDLMRFRGYVFRQQNIAIYLNGELIGRVNNIEKKTGTIENEFKEAALEHLKEGENTLAVATRQNWRWGMLFMKVYNDGFDFVLEARIPVKEE